MNEITIYSPNLPTFNNKELNKATQKIAKVADNMRKNLYAVAAILAKVAETECYIDDGFKSAAEYAMETFGFKKTAAYTLVAIGKEYTAPSLESNLPHLEGADFSTSQIEKILPLKSHEKAVELVSNGVITPEMSCKEIEAAVKAAMPKDEPETEVEPETVVEAEQETEAEPDEIYTVYLKTDSKIQYVRDATKAEVITALEELGAIAIAELQKPDVIRLFAELPNAVILYYLYVKA